METPFMCQEPSVRSEWQFGLAHAARDGTRIQKSPARRSAIRGAHWWVGQFTLTPWLVVAIVFGLGLAYALALDWTVQGYDDANYILLARSLASGQGYRLRQAAVPFAATPTLPFLLAPLWWLEPSLPGSVVWFKLVPLACALLSVPALLWYLIGQRQAPAWAATAIVLLALLAPPTFTYAARLVMTELPYLLFSTVALVLAHRLFVAGGPSPWSWLGVALSLAAACLTRTVGLTLLAGVLAFLVWRRRWWEALGLVLLVGALLLPWQIYVRLWGDLLLAPDQYRSDFLLREYGRPDLGQIESYWEVVARVLRNAAGHLDESLPGLFLPALTGPNILGGLQRMGLGWFRLAFGLCFALAAFLGWGVARKRGATPLEWYLPLYVGMILLPPWYHARNLVPIAPFLLYYLWLGLDAGTRWLAARAPALRPVVRTATPALFVVMLISALGSDRHRIRQGMNARAGRFPAWEESYYEAGDWIGKNAPATASVASLIEGKMELYTGRPVASLPRIEALEGAGARNSPLPDLVVIQPEKPAVKYEGYLRQDVQAYIRDHPERCTQLFISQRYPHTEVYECATP